MRVVAALVLFCALSACHQQIVCGELGGACCGDACHSGLVCTAGACMTKSLQLGDGQACTQNTDCASLACARVCASHCLSAADCVSGWECNSFGTVKGCQCFVTGDEVCDGLDNDCSGRADDRPADRSCRATNAGTRCQAGACACVASMCDGQCTDLDVTAAHCGSCDHACPSDTPACAAGECRTEFVSPSAPTRARDLWTVRERALFSAHNDGAGWLIERHDTLTGESLVISHATSVDTPLAATASRLYWGNVHEIDSVPFSGGLAGRVADLYGSCGGVVADETNIYWTDQSGVWQLPEGGNARNLTAQDGLRILQIASGSLLLTDGYTIYMRWPVDGSPPITYPNDGSCTGSPVIDGTSLYCSRSGAIVRLDPSGSSETLVPAVDGAAPPLAIEGGYLYWTRAGTSSKVPDDTIFRVPTTGGRSESVRLLLPTLKYLWVSSGNVVWVSADASGPASFGALLRP